MLMSAAVAHSSAADPITQTAKVLHQLTASNTTRRDLMGAHFHLRQGSGTAGFKHAAPSLQSIGDHHVGTRTACSTPAENCRRQQRRSPTSCSRRR